MVKNKLYCAGRVLDLAGEPLIMGILNVTPDSFSDGGLYLDTEKAVAHGIEMASAGAGIIDIGGESTRPGAAAVSAEQQIKRVVPVIEQLSRQVDVSISIDTTSSKVAVAALEAGAGIINDISGLRFDNKMAHIAAETGAALVIMHMQGEPGTMQQSPHYDDVVAEVKSFLASQKAAAMRAGVEESQIVVDPGIGFGKKLEHNLLLLKKLSEFRELGPVLVGPSRKSFIGEILGINKAIDRVWGTAAAVAWCAVAGAQIIRVHDVAEMKQSVKVIHAICRSQ